MFFAVRAREDFYSRERSERGDVFLELDLCLLLFNLFGHRNLRDQMNGEAEAGVRPFGSHTNMGPSGFPAHRVWIALFQRWVEIRVFMFWIPM